MPQLLVVTDLPEAGGKVVYRERIVSSDFESRHFTDQLTERVGWALRDANEATKRDEEPAGREEQDEPAPPGLTVLAG